jgi:CRISPR-associated protein Cas2
MFVGNVSAEVRDRLWGRACKVRGHGAGVLIHRAPTEQGFVVRVCGEPGREIVDFEGLMLVRVP